MTFRSCALSDKIVKESKEVFTIKAIMWPLLKGERIVGSIWKAYVTSGYKNLSCVGMGEC